MSKHSTAHPGATKSDVVVIDAPAVVVPTLADIEALAAPASSTVAVDVNIFNKLVADLEAMSAKMAKIEAQSEADYPDDYKLFIAVAGDRTWPELREQNKAIVEVVMTATGFYGPFEQDGEASIAAYLENKRTRNEEGAVRWRNATTVTGREKRAIEASERAERESTDYGRDVSKLGTNIFASRPTS